MLILYKALPYPGRFPDEGEARLNSWFPVARLDIKGNYYFKREFPRGVKILAKVFEKDAECFKMHGKSWKKMGQKYST